MLSEVSRVAAARPARPAPMTMTPVCLGFGGEESDGGESREICGDDDALGGLSLRR